MGGSSSPVRMRALLGLALVTVLGFQIFTHVHWFRVHGGGSADGVPCEDEAAGSTSREGVVKGNAVQSKSRVAPTAKVVVQQAESEVTYGDTPDAGCGNGPVDLVIAVLGAPTERSRIGRQSK